MTGPGDQTVDYEYIKSVGAHGVHAHHQFDVRLGSDREIWVGGDGSGLVRESRGPVSFFTEAGRPRFEAAGRPALVHGPDIVLYAPGCLIGSRVRRARMKSHPEGLAAALNHRRPLTLEAVRELLGEGLVDPVFCQQVFQAAQQLPDVTALDAVADQIGRRGPGLAQIKGVYLTELIFNADHSELLAYQHFYAEDVECAPAGVLSSWCAFLERRIQPGLPADVPPVPRLSGNPSRGREFWIRPGFSVSTGYTDDPLKQLTEMHTQGVLTAAEYASARLAHIWTGFNDRTASAWRELGLTPAEAHELTRAGS
jgi:hypothetical protein